MKITIIFRPHEVGREDSSGFRTTQGRFLEFLQIQDDEGRHVEFPPEYWTADGDVEALTLDVTAPWQMVMESPRVLGVEVGTGRIVHSVNVEVEAKTVVDLVDQVILPDED